MRHLLRIGALACAALLTANAAGQFTRVFPLENNGALGGVLLALFTVCFAWVALGAALFVFGLAAPEPGGPPQPALRRAGEREHGEGGEPRTAALIPIRHEDPGAVAAQIEVMFTGLERLGAAPVDFVILSDSIVPETCLAEEEAWRGLCGRLGGFGRIFYRRRAGGQAKKAGNIRDFCLRHASAYRYLIVLDADSMLAPETIAALIERMEANPRIGLIQAPSIPVRRRTLFARWQQFAARIYGPLWTRAEAALAGPDASYYGHNAILRREAFCSEAGLEALPGRGPLSGLIASHDFVEAALIRRAGYEVWTAADLGGSYEQCPTTLVDYAVRDQRWCHGNLQHMRVAALPGLAPWSRLHLLRGAASYLVPSLTLLFTWVMLLVAARDRAAVPIYFPPTGRTLFPVWPVHDFAAGRSLLALTAALLFGPKLVAAASSIAAMLWARELPARRIPALAASMVAESVLSALLAPSLMVYQAAFVVKILLGENVPWAAARREDRAVGPIEALRRCWLQLACAAALAGVSLWVSVLAFLWSLPLVAPLVLSPLLAWITSSRLAGRLCDALGLFQVPEDWSNDPALAVYDAPTPPAAPAGGEGGRKAAADDPRARAWHALVLVGSGLVGRTSPPASRGRETQARAG